MKFYRKVKKNDKLLTYVFHEFFKIFRWQKLYFIYYLLSFQFDRPQNM